MRSPSKALGGALASRQVAKEISIPPPAHRFETLGAAADAYDAWLRKAALPLWASAGVDAATGGFREALTWQGQPADPRRRTRVQARQAFVFASAAADGIAGGWLPVAQAGRDFLFRYARRPDGLLAHTLDLDGAQTDPTPAIYEHAFVLLALVSLHRAGDPTAAAQALDLRDALQALRHSAGGFREAGTDPFQANAHMHLFEAALAWEQAGGEGGWARLADEIANLALFRFIDPTSGALREFFEADWTPRVGEPALIEPGHQFEWAWLLAQWGAARGDPKAQGTARRLFAVGRRGFDPARNVVANALWEDLSVRDAAARLWPQTEHLKAALLLGEDAAALEAANGLAAYLDTPVAGVWRERMRADGGFIEEPSPATSFYHLFLAIRELTRSQLAEGGDEPC